MFDENFSFDPSRSPSLDSSNSPSTRDISPATSPCSAAVASYPPPRFSVTDLAAQFADQRIQHTSRICHDTCEAYANLDEDAGWQIEPEPSIEDVAACGPRHPRSRTSHTAQRPPTRPHSPSSQRQHRQISARMLLNPAHHRDIAALVSRMVASNDQCSVSSSAAPDRLPPAVVIDEDDEGYDSSDAPSRPSSLAAPPPRPRLDYRRSLDMRSTMTGACVSKSARLRKDRALQHRRVRSAEKS